jgi:hypothetical protein
MLRPQTVAHVHVVFSGHDRRLSHEADMNRVQEAARLAGHALGMGIATGQIEDGGPWFDEYQVWHDRLRSLTSSGPLRRQLDAVANETFQTS